VRVKLGSETVPCIVCARDTAHDLFVSGAPGALHRHRPQTDLRYYSLCLTCGTKIPQQRAAS
jgi:hypothetical protein